MRRRRRASGLGLGVALSLLAACSGAGSGPAEPSASEKAAEPPASVEPGQEAPGKSDEASAAEAGGLAHSVEQQVKAAREGEPAAVTAPEVAAGAPLLAVVNGIPVPRAGFDEIYGLKIKKYDDRGRPVPKTADRRYRRSIALRLIDQERLRQEVVALGIDYDPAALAEREASQRRGIRDWAKHLERRGETERSLRDMVIAELREAAILEARGRLEVSRADIEADYEKIKGNWEADEPRVRAAHILVPIERPEERGAAVDPAAEAAAKAEAERLYALATAPGADFAELARAHSTGPSASKGGDVGIFTRDRMAEEFSDVAFSARVGSIAKPVKTKFGYHVIKVLGRWPAGELPIDALEDQIRERLGQRQLHAGRRELADELEAKYPATHHVLTPDELREPAPRGNDRETKTEIP